MDERTIDTLVRSISAQLHTGGVPSATNERPGADGFFLVDRWRVWEEHKPRFVEFYREHVIAVVEQLRGFRRVLALGSPPGERPAWNLEALFEFESDDILDSFHGDFADQYGRAFPGRTVEDLLAELEPWVVAHDDSTMVRL